jgi:hypothetical protein
VGTNRLNIVAKKVVSPTLTVFMPGRNIMEGEVILHETIHELHIKKGIVSFSKLILKRRMTKLSGLSYNKPYV